MEQNTHELGSKAFSLNTADLKKIVNALVLQIVAVACVYAVQVLNHAEMPQYLLFLMPTVSTGLYAISRWATDRSQNLYKIEE